MQLQAKLPPEEHSSRRRQKEVSFWGRGVPGLSCHLLEASPRRDSFWLLVVSRGGGLAKHLFHGF